MLRAYRQAYEEGVDQDENGLYRIALVDIEKWIGYEPVKAELRTDLEAIRKEAIIYNVLGKGGTKVMRGSGFISEWEVTSNWIGFKLPGFLCDCIQRLDLANSMFQRLNWSVFNSFSGKYEAVLYKLCKDYVDFEKRPQITMNVEQFREYMGIGEGEYQVFKDLNKFVISGPVKRINANELSDITIRVETARESSRKIDTLHFYIEQKRQTALDFGDDPAFRLARVPIELPRQREYLEKKTPEEIEHAILRANEYGEEQEKLGKEVKFGALYRKAIEEGWGRELLTKKARETEKVAAQKKKKAADADEAKRTQIEDLRNGYMRQICTEAIKALPVESRHAYAQKYIEEEAGKGRAPAYNPDKAAFIDKIENIKFSGWLRVAVAPAFDQVAFASWVKEEKGIDPKTLGL